MTKTRSPLGILFLTVFLDLVGFGLVIPLVQKYVEFYWGRDSPYVDRIATALSASYSLAQFVAAPMWGAISDRFGRRPVLLVTIPLTAVAYLLFGLAADPGVNGVRVEGQGASVVIWLFVARTLGGLGGANISTAFAYVADVTTPANRSRGLGMIGAAFGLGFVFGPFLGGILFKHLGRGGPGYAAGALGLVNFVWAFARLPESLPPERRGAPAGPRQGRFAALRESLAAPTLGRYLVLMFLATFSFAHMEQSLALYLGERADRGGRAWDEEHIGYFFAFFGVVMAATQGGLLRRLAKRYHERPLVLAGWSLLTFGLLGIGVFGARGWPLAALGFAGLLVSLGNGISNPSLNALISRASSEQTQGATFGAATSAASLARILGPLSVGWISDLSARAVPMYVAAAGIVVAIGLLAAAPAPETAAET